MKRIIFLLFFIWISKNMCAQTVFISDSSDVTFYSYALLEDIKASSNSMSSMINTATGEVAFMIPMRSFRFAKSLMQEHFNEKYIESEKYPHATFKGKINEKIDISKNGIYEMTATGTFSIHGKEKAITEKGTIEVKLPAVILNSEFHVAIADYNITVPQILFNNIADTIDVKMKVYYEPYKKK